MKKLLLICSIISATIAVKAQGYESVIGTISTGWQVAYHYPDASFTTSYTLTDTVVVNGITYHQLNRHETPTSLVMREDTALGKVWVYHTAFATETLVNDMSMEIGDSLFIDSYYYATVDLVYIENNRKHVRFNRYINWQQTQKLEFIEGVGPNAGPLFLLEGNFESTQLVCATKDGISTYTDSTLFNNGPCIFSIASISSELKKPAVSVYPNPATDVITFSNLEETSAVQIQITDALGRVVHSGQTSADEPQINTSAWPTGLYFYQVQAAGKLVASGKLMIGK